MHKIELISHRSREKFYRWWPNLIQALQWQISWSTTVSPGLMVWKLLYHSAGWVCSAKNWRLHTSATGLQNLCCPPLWPVSQWREQVRGGLWADPGGLELGQGWTSAYNTIWRTVSSLDIQIHYLQIGLSARGRIATCLSLSVTLFSLSAKTVQVHWGSLVRLEAGRRVWARLWEEDAYGLFMSRRQHQCCTRGKGRDAYTVYGWWGKGVVVIVSNQLCFSFLRKLIGLGEFSTSNRHWYRSMENCQTHLSDTLFKCIYQ